MVSTYLFIADVGQNRIVGFCSVGWSDIYVFCFVDIYCNKILPHSWTAVGSHSSMKTKRNKQLQAFNLSYIYSIKKLFKLVLYCC